MKNNKYCIIQKNEKYFLKFDKDSFKLEITKEQFHEIKEDITFRLLAENNGSAVCYPPAAERIRLDCINKKLADTFKNIKRFESAIDNIVKVCSDFADNFCEGMKVLKPILEQETKYIIIYNDGYKKLKPRKKKERTWNTRN